MVTGAASGFGREIALQLALRGEAVALWDVYAEGLEETRRWLGSARSVCVHADVTDPDSLAQAAATTRAALGPIAHLVNSAGILRVGPTASMPLSEFRRLMEVNYLGSVSVALTLLDDLTRAAKSGGRATLLLISSVAGLRGFPELAGYSASKHAIVGFGQALRDEMRGTGVDVRVLCPPTGDTPMFRNLSHRPKIYDLAPALPAENIVRAALAALEDDDDLLVLVDARSRAMLRVHQLIPALMDRIVARTIR